MWVERCIEQVGLTTIFKSIASDSNAVPGTQPEKLRYVLLSRRIFQGGARWAEAEPGHRNSEIPGLSTPPNGWPVRV
jgi:hypothetical protein